MNLKFALIILIVCELVKATKVKRTVKELQLYEVENFYYCNKFLSNDRELGCWTQNDLNGVLFKIENQTHLFQIQNQIDFQFIVYLTRFNLDLIKNSLHVTNILGVLLLCNSTLEINFKNIILNKPIVLITNKNDQENIEIYYNKFNKGSREYESYVNLKSNMIGFKNSETCLRRTNRFNFFSSVVKVLHIYDNDSKLNKFCSHVNLKSVWAFTKKSSQNSILFVTKLNTFQMFRSTKSKRFGSYSTMILIGVADLISKLQNELNDNQVVFGLLGSEENDYLEMGSNKSSLYYAKKIIDNQFYNLTKDSILNVIELDKLTNIDSKFYTYNNFKNIQEGFCSFYTCENYTHESSFINYFNSIPGLSISAFNETTLFDDTNSTLNHSIDLILQLTNLIFDLFNIKHVKLSRNLINKELVINMINCQDWDDCSSLENFLVNNDLVEISILKYVLRNSKTSSNDSFIIVENLSLNETLTQSNEIKSAKLNIYLKPKYDYVTVVFGFVFSSLTILLTFLSNNKKI